METRYIEPAALHEEMRRLRNEKQMDFLESLTGMEIFASGKRKLLNL